PSHSLGPIARGLPGRLSEEATQAFEPRTIDAFLNPTQRGELSVFRVCPPILIAHLRVQERAALSVIVAPDGIPLDQEGACQTELGPTRAVQHGLQLCLIVAREVVRATQQGCPHTLQLVPDTPYLLPAFPRRRWWRLDELHRARQDHLSREQIRWRFVAQPLG